MKKRDMFEKTNEQILGKRLTDEDLFEFEEGIKVITKGQPEKLSNYGFLKMVIDDKKALQSDLSVKGNDGLNLILDRFLLSNYVLVRSDFSLEIKRLGFSFLDELILYIGENNGKYYYLYDEILEEINRLNRIEEAIAKANIVSSLIKDITIPTLYEEKDYIFSTMSEFQKLSEEEVQYVSGLDIIYNAIDDINDMDVALKMDERINNLNPMPTLNDEVEIINCLNDYNNLSNKQHGYVKNANVLFSVVDSLDLLKKKTRLMHEAKLFDKQIEITYNCIFDKQIDDKIKERSYEGLIDCYNKLDEEIKDYLENEEFIEQMSSEMEKIYLLIADYDEAMSVYNDINALPNNSLLIEREGFNLLVDRYNNLNRSDLVTNSEILWNNKDFFEKFDKASGISNLICGLKDYKMTDELEYANALYNELSSDEKNMVIGYDILSDLLLKNKKYEENLNLAKILDEEILSLKIDENINRLMLLKARYDLLEEQEVVNNYYLLEESIIRANNCERARELNKEIAGFNNPTLWDLKKLEEIYYEYECLSKDGKSLVTNINRLDEMMELMNSKMNKVKQIDEKIIAIGEAEIHEGNDIADVKTAYEMLLDDEKAFIGNYHRLVELENNFIKLSSVYDNINLVKSYVDEHIINLKEIIDDPMIEINKKKEYYVLVYNMYQNLNQEQKNNVKYYNELIEIGKSI